ncbi:PQ loop repeat-domain-containing protein [Catenaria anguillulae PL171]|uniref:PQ loop repeat-domain-containing protein n=1 Tax=Catenaria anguillulae PL171 TaxID=765915 RepID=A0A1Y2HGH3_9FUNG|nr:PQ loop repeat-domain-containing protein [Catenaria anguillulae PL171]
MDSPLPLLSQVDLCRPGHFSLIAWVFRECAYSWGEAAAVLLGYASIGFWLFCQTPQLVANWRAKTAESLSLSFLFIWLGGDVMNLAGCLLTSQQPFQTYLAAYFVLIDFSLCVQSAWYNLICPPRFPDECVTIPSSPATAYNTLAIAPSPTPRMTQSSAPSRAQTPSIASAPHSRRPRQRRWVTLSCEAHGCDTRYHGRAIHRLTLALPSSSTAGLPTPDLLTPPPATNPWFPLSSYAIGVAASYCCSFLYLTSRLPQIAHNARRKSVQGLSISMFMFAVGGNTTMHSAWSSGHLHT